MYFECHGKHVYRKIIENDIVLSISKYNQNLVSDLQKLDCLADPSASQELRTGEGPGHLRQEGQQSRQHVGQGEMHQEVVHPGHLERNIRDSQFEWSTLIGRDHRDTVL